MVSTQYKLQLNSNRNKDLYISYASIQLAPYEYWTASDQNIFTLQTNFLRPSGFDLHNDHSNPKFQSVIKKRVHQKTYKHFGRISLPTSQKISSLKRDSSHLHFHLICSII